MTDPQIIAAVLSAQKTSEATLQAANWTAWATIIASFIGAVGILIAAKLAFKSGLKTQQHNNIIEAKREVYLDAIAQYQKAINNLKLITITPSSFREVFFNDKKEFYVAVNKVFLICNNENKDVVSDLQTSFDSSMNDLIRFFENYIDSYFSMLECRDKYTALEKEYSQFEKENPFMYSVKELGDGPTTEIAGLSVRFKIARDQLSAAEIGSEFVKSQVEDQIENAVSELNSKYIKFSEKLRTELMSI